MSDQPLQGVTTRSLDTSQDIERAGAISTRSGLARAYADQFRADRNLLRRGAVTRTPTIVPDVPAPSGDVTQTQDPVDPGAFEDVAGAAGDIQGNTQPADQTINPGMGGFGRTIQGPGDGEGADTPESSGSERKADPQCPSGWRNYEGCTDAPVGVDCFRLVNDDGELVAIGDCDGDTDDPAEQRRIDAERAAAAEENATGGNENYFYTKGTYNRSLFGRGASSGIEYTAYQRNPPKRLHSIAATPDGKRICRSLMDCYTGGGARISFYNQQFGLGLRRS